MVIRAAQCDEIRFRQRWTLIADDEVELVKAVLVSKVYRADGQIKRRWMCCPVSDFLGITVHVNEMISQNNQPLVFDVAEREWIDLG